jgi:hypothetical protein
LCVAANNAEIGDQLAFARRRHAGPGRLDDADKVVARGERQWPCEVRISAATDEGISEAGAGGEHLDPDLARTGVRNGLSFCQFQDLGAAELSDTDVLPRHALTVAVIVTGVMPHVAASLSSRREGRRPVRLRNRQRAACGRSLAFLTFRDSGRRRLQESTDALRVLRCL